MLKPAHVITLSIGLMASFSTFAADAPLKTLNEKASYIMGMNLGKQMAAQRSTIELDQVIMGIKDAYNGNQLKMTQAEMQAVAAESPFHRTAPARRMVLRIGPVGFGLQRPFKLFAVQSWTYIWIKDDHVDGFRLPAMALQNGFQIHSVTTKAWAST